jgi:hypothetical protein
MIFHLRRAMPIAPAKEEIMNTDSRIRHTIVLVALLLELTTTAPSGLPAVQAAAEVQLPSVTGPIPMTEASRAFWDRMGPPREAALKADYIEEEYFVKGTANVYEWNTDGSALPIIRTPNAPYTTRIIVRRPARPSKFSGTVWIEPLNPTLSIDLDRMWQLHYSQIISDGDAYVGITAKPVAIVALQTFDPERYGQLSMANPLAPAEQMCGKMPGESGYNLNTSKLYENGLIWDIISQVGVLLKSDSPHNPLKAAAKTVYGEGWSQTGGYANRYLSTFGPLAMTSDGKRVYDGWLVGGAGGPTGINQCSQPLPNTDPRQQIQPNGVPVIAIRTQGDTFSFPYRRADGDAPDNRYRLYELGGATHDTITIFQNFAPDADIVKAGVKPPDHISCGYQITTDFPYEYYFSAAAANLKLWSRGVAPPHADRFQFDDKNQNVLDQFGNAVGGLRSPYLDVPIATYHMGKNGGSFTCSLLGYKTLFSRNLLKKLYRDHDDYLSKIKQITERLVKERFLLSKDAEKILAEAKEADVP